MIKRMILYRNCLIDNGNFEFNSDKKEGSNCNRKIVRSITIFRTEDIFLTIVILIAIWKSQYLVIVAILMDLLIL